MSVLVRVRLVGSRHMDVNVAVPPCVTHTCHPAFVPARSLLPSAPAGVPGLPCRPPQVLLHGDRMLTWCFERVAVFIKTGVCVCVCAAAKAAPDADAARSGVFAGVVDVELL